MRGAALLARSAAGIGSTLGLLYWAAGSPVHDLNIACDSPDFGRALAAAVGVVAWACSMWFATVVAAVALAAVPGAAGRCGARIAHRLGPQLMRAAARWIVGATLIAGPLASTPAFAAAPAANSGPNLDRPVAAAPVTSAPDVVARATAAGYPTNASVDLDRPVSSYLPPPPVDPTPTAATGSVTLLTGIAHRDSADDGYVVRRGDTLWDVAARHLGPNASAADVAREWPRWYAANRGAIGSDPQLILPGMVLHAPAG